MTFRANVFPKLRTHKDVVRKISKKCRFPLPFDKQHGKRCQRLYRSTRRHVYDIHGSLQKIFSLKKSLLVICQILILFVNRFTADDKYSLLTRDNLTLPIQMQLSPKQENLLSVFFCSFEI